MELGPREEAVQSVDDKWSDCTQDEAEWQIVIDVLLE